MFRLVRRHSTVSILYVLALLHGVAFIVETETQFCFFPITLHFSLALVILFFFTFLLSNFELMIFFDQLNLCLLYEDKEALV